jgi:sulfur carrier protein
MEIIYNGQPRPVTDAVSIATLLGELDLESRYVAVEVNLELVPRGQHAQHRLNPGDRVEVVTLVGGG